MSDYEDEFIEIKESMFIKALNRFDDDVIDEVLERNDQSLDDIYLHARCRSERLYVDFMKKLYDYIDEMMKASEKNNFNPDYEDWKKNPNDPIWKTID